MPGKGRPFVKGDPRAKPGPGRPPKGWLNILGTYEDEAAHSLGKAVKKDWRAAERVGVHLHGQPREKIETTGEITIHVKYDDA